MRFLIALVALITCTCLPGFDRTIATPLTQGLAVVAGEIIGLIDGDTWRSGSAIHHKDSPFVAIIDSACSGIEVLMILVAGIVAVRATLQHKAIIALVAFAIIELTNVARIVSLFFVGRWSVIAFDWGHTVVWPSLLAIEALTILLFYQRRLAPRREPITQL